MLLPGDQHVPCVSYQVACPETNAECSDSGTLCQSSSWVILCWEARDVTPLCPFLVISARCRSHKRSDTQQQPVPTFCFLQEAGEAVLGFPEPACMSVGRLICPRWGDESSRRGDMPVLLTHSIFLRVFAVTSLGEILLKFQQRTERHCVCGELSSLPRMMIPLIWARKYCVRAVDLEILCEAC